jgi:hypothetical protein
MNLGSQFITDLPTLTQHLQKDEENDNNLIDLAHDMNRTLSYVTIVEDRAKIENLKLVVKEMMELVKNASHFIVDYFSKGRLSMCFPTQNPLQQLMLHSA